MGHSYRAPLDGWRGNPHAISFSRKTCRACEREFLGRGDEWSAPFYCSVGCKAEVQRQRRAEARKPKKPIRCAQCNERFTPRRSTARYCSARCRVAAHRAQEA
jgi:hypothetical protein